MINSSQFETLNTRFASHECRTLFIFEITVFADSTGKYEIDYNRLIQALTVFANDGTVRFKPTYKNINNYLHELCNLKLISISLQDKAISNEDVNYQGAIIQILETLPQPTPKSQNFDYSANEPENIFPMYESWFPSSRFNELSRIANLINNNYTLEDLASFRSYWMSRPNKSYSALLWDQKFIQNLKRKHSIMQNKVPVYSGIVGLQRK